MDPVCATSGGATSGVPESCQSMSNTYCAEPVFVECGKRGRRAVGSSATRNKLHSRAFDVLGDAPSTGVVGDVGEEVDSSAQPGQPDGHVERAAADVLASYLAVTLDDVDQRLADDQGARS